MTPGTGSRGRCRWQEKERVVGGRVFFGGNSGPISWSFVSITLRLFSRPLLYLLCVLVRTLMLTSLAVSYFSLYVFYSVPRWRLFLFLDGGWVLLGPCLLVVVVVFIFFGLFEGDKNKKERSISGLAPSDRRLRHVPNRVIDPAAPPYSSDLFFSSPPLGFGSDLGLSFGGFLNRAVRSVVWAGCQVTCFLVLKLPNSFLLVVFCFFQTKGEGPFSLSLYLFYFFIIILCPSYCPVRHGPSRSRRITYQSKAN